MSPKIPTLFVLALMGSAGLCSAARAELQAPPQNVVHLSAQASTEVANDQLTVVFSVRREGPEAAAVQSQLKQALEAALAEAKAGAPAEGLSLQTGQFTVSPRYLPKVGHSGWTGVAELVVQGRDLPAVSALTGRVRSMTISRVAWSLSRQARDKVEAEVTAEAVAAFRTKADRSARWFGFSGWLLREVTVGQDTGRDYAPPVRALQARAAMAEAEELPTEAGKSTVTATANGSVQLTR